MSIHALPPGLPVPIDDGACDHLAGLAVPAIVLGSSQGPINLAVLGEELAALYVYPRPGKPGDPVPESWDAIPGAHGCTPQSCGFRGRLAELAGLGARIASLSTQPLDEQVELAGRLGLRYAVIADPQRRLGAAPRAPDLRARGGDAVPTRRAGRVRAGRQGVLPNVSAGSQRAGGRRVATRARMSG